ncbi:carbohydrate ABC transporter permease [Oscillospiraceae bacterium PP1C4]
MTKNIIVPNKRKFRFSLSKFIIYLVLIIWALTTILPFLWVINSSFKTSNEILNNSFSLPLNPTWDNYINAFEKQNILRSYFNSFLISGTTTVLVMALSSMLAFAITRYKFKAKKLIHTLIISSLMFPAFSTIIPVFRMLAQMQLINNPLGVILPQVAGNLSFATLVMTGFMESIPRDCEEAAFIEGCNVYQIFCKVIIPLSRPSLATVAIFTFLWSYNDLFTQFIIIRSREQFPICTLLNEISSKYGHDFGLMASSVTLIVIPVIIVYIFLQKNIVKGLTAGAVKG